MLRRTRRTVTVAAIVCVATSVAACTATSDADVPPTIAAIMDQPLYDGGRWGMSVIDIDSGETLIAVNPDDQFLTGSTAKVLSVTAALDLLGADATFTTPVIAAGTVGNGILEGDLILRGSGDLTLGGRTLPDGTLDVPIFDHYDANVLPGLATLTPEDPLTGLDDLAQQVAVSGIRTVTGDVLVDDRLWDPVVLDGVPISPIVVNDNLVDIVFTPGQEVGDPTTARSRPETAAYSLANRVSTADADSGIDITITERDGILTATGTIPLGVDPVVQTYQVPEPAAWARTLFIEALARAGVTVEADPVSPSSATLPPSSELDQATPIATFTSPPFSETARLINKVSHNLGANQLPLLLAVQEGERTLEAGLARQMSVLEAAGLGPDDVVIADGQGLPGNRITPAAMTSYLVSLTGAPYFTTFLESTPILGVDGSLANVLPEGDPAIGSAHAKTGTLVGPGTDTPYLLETKALAGYLDAASGRHLAFAVFVNDVPITEVQAVLQANADLGAIASQLFQLY
ncbi:D-alanyl-D-alanine carboxypeptidase/D-alanyl-D-alanine endopeptidase [Microbacterium schleiferi]|uniref:D-alanyl-D-alanine carboxypeptidase/D-alanyl-D-alanine-endopeptidase n=1 Tax=Microbacterium schleiferi TaxID=69362 RepID=A0ABU7V7Y9_9MICO|nr:D-alanyl-D-alanine carboxypeptidase/D-alanyl-D-alanine-endopeptidase [Micrococcales bacterium]